MGTEQITMQIDDEAARAFRSASVGERQNWRPCQHPAP